MVIALLADEEIFFKRFIEHHMLAGWALGPQACRDALFLEAACNWRRWCFYVHIPFIFFCGHDFFLGTGRLWVGYWLDDRPVKNGAL